MQYKPSENHPWKKSYKAGKDVKETKKKYKPVKSFICEIAQSYGNIEIFTYNTNRKKYLQDLPQSKQASWIVSMLKKYYQTY